MPHWMYLGAPGIWAHPVEEASFSSPHGGSKQLSAWKRRNFLTLRSCTRVESSLIMAVRSSVSFSPMFRLSGPAFPKSNKPLNWGSIFQTSNLCCNLGCLVSRRFRRGKTDVPKLLAIFLFRIEKSRLTQASWERPWLQLAYLPGKSEIGPKTVHRLSVLHQASYRVLISIVTQHFWSCFFSLLSHFEAPERRFFEHKHVTMVTSF